MLCFIKTASKQTPKIMMLTRIKKRQQINKLPNLTSYKLYLILLSSTHPHTPFSCSKHEGHKIVNRLERTNNTPFLRPLFLPSWTDVAALTSKHLFKTESDRSGQCSPTVNISRESNTPKGFGAATLDQPKRIHPQWQIIPKKYTFCSCLSNVC